MPFRTFGIYLGFEPGYIGWAARENASNDYRQPCREVFSLPSILLSELPFVLVLGFISTVNGMKKGG